MGKVKRKITSLVLVGAMFLCMISQNTVFAGDSGMTAYNTASSDYITASGAFWEAIKAYCGEWSGEVLFTMGAYYEYKQALENGDDNASSLYIEAQTARENCESKYAVLQEKYTVFQNAYGALAEEEQGNVFDSYNNLNSDYSRAVGNMNDLPILEEPGEEPLNGEYQSIYIDELGNFDGNESAPEYWKVNDAGNIVEATAEDYTMRIEKTADGVKMTLRNFQFTGVPEGSEGDAVWSEVPLTLVLEGTNSITGTKGSALGVIGNLTITGSGSLALSSTSGEVTAEDGTKYIPLALQVYGGLTNSAVVTCSSNNPESTVFIDCTSKDIVNTGSITVGENQKIITNDGSCAKIDKPVSAYESSADYPVPTDHPYVAKAYYYTEDMLYPNDMYDYGDDTSQWTIVGKYDENGKPIGSNVWYQYWYVDSRGGMLTEDIVNPVQYLVYEDNPESLIKDKDIVSVTDGKSHTFNADLYALWFTKGNVTVNGNVIMDLACANVAERKDSGNPTYLDYVWTDDGKRVWTTESTADSNVTVNGNVGLVSLNNSYIGNLTVNGNVDLFGYYDDLDPSVQNTLSFVPESFYGSKSDAGAVIKNGEFVGLGTSLDGYVGYSVYGTEDFYSMTERVISGETVHGTSAAIGDESLLIDVSKSVVGATTYPCAKAVDSSREKLVKDVLTKTDSKLVVMDISLIQDNAKKVEPETTVNLYIDNLSGFSKPAVYHVKDDGTIEKLFVYDGSGAFGGSVTCQTNSFSTYFVAEDQELRSNKLGDKGTDSNPPTETKPSDKTTNTTNTSTTNATNTNQANANKTIAQTSPKTGDATATGMVYVLFFAGMSMLTVGRYRKRNRLN